MSSNDQEQSKQICPGPGEPGLVSVVLPTYNRAYCVAATIDSVLAQSYKNLELIVVDDGSTDGTSSVIAQYGSAVRYIQQPNGGVASARNTAFEVARGEYIALIDSDDRWQPWKLELQVAFLRRHPEASMVWTDMSAVTDAGEQTEERFLRKMYHAYEWVRTEDIMTRTGVVAELDVNVPPQYAQAGMWVGDIFSPLIRGTLMHTPTTLLRRTCVRETGGYDEDLKPAGEDFDFHLRAAVQGPVGFLDLPTIDYRVGNDDQITAPSGAAAMGRAYLKTVDKWLNLHPAKVKLSKAELAEVFGYAHLWVGSQALLSGETTSARQHLRASFRAQPFRPKTTAMVLLAHMPAGTFTALQRLRGRVSSPD